ncbi:hypothetical protein H8959_015878 [Pygathrix nigripes]
MRKSSPVKYDQSSHNTVQIAVTKVHLSVTPYIKYKFHCLQITDMCCEQLPVTSILSKCIDESLCICYLVHPQSSRQKPLRGIVGRLLSAHMALPKSNNMTQKKNIVPYMITKCQVHLHEGPQSRETKSRLKTKGKKERSRTDQNSRTALHRACSARQAEIVEFLLQLGVPVNDKGDAGWSPLHTVASAGQDEIVKALLGKCAQVNAVSQNGCTPLHYTASKNRHEIAAMLLEGGADSAAEDHCEATAMHRAAAKGNLKMIRILLYYRTSTNIRTLRVTLLYT